MDQFLGEIRPVAFNFAPRGWAFCSGQLLSISQNTALFSLLGTNYGGDGRSNFALPNLLDNVVISQGQGPGLSGHVIGETGGEANHSLSIQEMPSHTHGLKDDQDPATSRTLSGFPAETFSHPIYAGTPNATLAPQSVGNTGVNIPHNNLMPSLAITYIIALQGIYPQRQ